MPDRFRSAARLAALLATLALPGCLSTPDDASRAAVSDHGFTPAAEGALYHFGYALGESVAVQQLDERELDELVEGLRDRAQNREPRYGSAAEHQADIASFLALRRREVGEKRFETERPFLETAAREPGAHTTEGGAVVLVLEPGAGATPEPGEVLRMHFDGALIDGTPVRSTRDEKPFVLVLDRANPCWREALLGHGAPGARLRVTCPPEMLFGMKGKLGWTPAGAVSVWNLDLLESDEP